VAAIPAAPFAATRDALDAKMRGFQPLVLASLAT
jgi:hypothetical protein